MWTGEKEAFENGDEKSVIFCHIYQRFRLFFSAGDRRQRISVNKLKQNENANAIENIWFCLRTLANVAYGTCAHKVASLSKGTIRSQTIPVSDFTSYVT